jgi:hypothetical protein
MSRKAIIVFLLVYLFIYCFCGQHLVGAGDARNCRRSVRGRHRPNDWPIVGLFVLLGVLPLIYWAVRHFRAESAYETLGAWSGLGMTLLLLAALGKIYDGTLQPAQIPSNAAAVIRAHNDEARGNNGFSSNNRDDFGAPDPSDWWGWIRACRATPLARRGAREVRNRSLWCSLADAGRCI